ncbi:hypothetical protein CDL15_Pgr008837 [Punica granatum]|uniref:Uncharacterized protein n=1 Tax=Punica granatum TaxID=22663 RepID=A0A218VXD0_PUNGR|nr:hypothetical protein CDL15_Pgr008837 [Punica granatum]
MTFPSSACLGSLPLTSQSPNLTPTKTKKKRKRRAARTLFTAASFLPHSTSSPGCFLNFPREFNLPAIAAVAAPGSSVLSASGYPIVHTLSLLRIEWRFLLLS